MDLILAMDLSDKLWIGWTIGAGGSWGIIELWMIKNKNAGTLTLSQTVQRMFWIARLAIIAGLIGLAYHFGTGWPW